MSTITDWLMCGITLIYVIATFIICIYNKKTEKATHQQIDESKRQFEESKRLETMPFLQLEIPAINETPVFEIEIDLCEGKTKNTLYKNVRLKNLGNGSASNIIYEWKGINSREVFDYPPINAIMHGDSYYFQFAFNTDEKVITGTIGVLTWKYDDLLGNSYEQKVSLIFDEDDLVRCENDTPTYLGVIKYKLAD